MGAREAAKSSREADGASKVVPISSLYAADLASALWASLVVSPFITIVDRSIIQNASGTKRMGDSVRAGFKELFLRPHVFLRRPEFFMIWGVYASTYTAANAVVTSCERRQVDNRLPKFIGTSVVNIATCISKDREFTRMFGATKPKSVPVPLYLLFMVRDGITIGASFNMPTPMSKYLQERAGLSDKTADIVSQLACPAGIQFFSTPLHLLGLDLYNKPKNSAYARGKFLASAYIPSVAMRICRIGPAFGIGGVGNTAFRKYFRSLAE
ncbi:unnamed protein product [Ascophyllum nodosum]